MSKWFLRGLVLAAAMVVLRLLQGALINVFETWALPISVTLLVIYTVAVLVWGLIDGRADARANPDPDNRGNLAIRWLMAGVFAGVVSGLVTWFVSLFYKAVYADGLLPEITTTAAFTALLVFVPAMITVLIGRLLVDRSAPAGERKRGDDGDRADTDVFAAVRDEDFPAGDRSDSRSEGDESPTERLGADEQPTAGVGAHRSGKSGDTDRGDTEPGDQSSSAR